MTRHAVYILILGLLLPTACSAAQTATPAPTATAEAAPAKTQTHTAAPTATRAPAPTATPTPTATGTATPAATPPPSFTPIRTATRTLTRTPTPTPRPTPPQEVTPIPDLLRQVVAIEDVLPGRFPGLRPAPDGTLWLTTDQAIARGIENTWTVVLAEYTGRLVGMDAQGRVWVVSDDTIEISAWDGASWTVYAADEGWIPLTDDWRVVRGGSSDELGRFWLTTSQDVRVFEGARWTVFTPQDMGMGEVGREDLAAEFVLTSVKDSGTVWVGECDWGGPGPFGGQGARWFDGQVWHGADTPVAAGCVTVISSDPAGHVWLGVDADLWRYDPTTASWTQFAPPVPPYEAPRFGFVVDIALDPTGDPWPILALCGGASCFNGNVLYHLQDGAWSQITERDETGTERLVFDAAGAAWLFWAGDLYRVKGETLETVAGLFAQSVVLDANGQVWFVATHSGRDVLFTIPTQTGD